MQRTVRTNATSLARLALRATKRPIFYLGVWTAPRFSKSSIEASSHPKGVDDISHAGHMDVVEIDVVGMQSSQRLFALRYHGLPSSSATVWIADEEVHNKLRRDHCTITLTFVLSEKVSDDLFGVPQVADVREPAASFAFLNW